MLSLIPVIFFGHGSPMNAVVDNQYTKSWHNIANSFKKPKAIVCISAHWQTNGTKITSNQIQKTIYDFYGFPNELYDIKYEAKGYVELARKINKVIPEIELDDTFGLDHGTWLVLSKIYPLADVPVLQISIDRNKTLQQHFELAEKLKFLRKEDVLIIGSGNIVHNLRMLDWSGNKKYDWAVGFNDEIKKAIINDDIERILNYSQIKGSRHSVPTLEHFIPLIYILALKNKEEKPTFFAEGFEMGSLSMDSVGFGLK